MEGIGIKVAMLTSELFPVFAGGLGKAVYNFAKALQDQLDITIFIPKLGWQGDLKCKVTEIPFDLSLHVYKTSEKFSYAEDWDSRSQTAGFNKALAKLVSLGHFDIVHAHDWMTFPAGIELKEKGVPLVVHMHSTEYDRTGGNPRDWVVDIEKAGMEKADLVITNSRYLQCELEKLYGIPASKIRLVYNGINIQKFQKSFFGTKKLGPYVLFVGRHTIQKGLWQLLHAARMVVDKRPDVKFMIVGKGPDTHSLIQLAADLGLHENVIFTGKVSEEQLVAAYRLADLFVMPSVSEPFGLVALEAAAAEKPIIISKTSGVAEFFYNCFKVDYWDTKMLASHILELLEYSPLSDEMSLRGFREAQNFTWDKVSQGLLSVYKEMKNG